ncbi:hypothetical protein [Neotabrizicola shimadae]|uniref:Uncharacterized protein n=1 Tax=Neotabrizicola shimadae TaxID=2807096 RepID=A0A8G0ZXQ1_9RHOB|nr:hypothetical protein [Neotabrizicola shimadae]QYZ69984.1 hypothetical protein JO391_00100 [Neotabrizicola shimadae]
MTALTFAPPRPLWLILPAAGALAWNIFGLIRFADSLTQTPESLMAQGLTEAQALLYAGLPGWMTLAFALGTGLGTLGGLLLLLRRSTATWVLAVSLAAYIALFTGDLAHGVFDGMPAQLAILVVVVAIAAALFALSLVARNRGILR